MKIAHYDCKFNADIMQGLSQQCRKVCVTNMCKWMLE